jgi:hypothetical protein
VLTVVTLLRPTFHPDGLLLIMKGFLLTLSPPTGINYLDKNFRKYLEEPVEHILDNDDSSALSHMFQVFSETGTSTWHKKTVEWFLVYLITEIGATPHAVRKAHSAVTMVAAYRNIVDDLVCNKSSKSHCKAES